MERYTRVYSLRKNLYTEDSLVIIEAGALLRDNANNTMLAQVKFKNINPKAIKMLKVEIIPKDSMGRVLEPSTTYQYLDLNAQRDISFGSQHAITLPDSAIRSFDVKVLEVGLEDNSIVNGSEAKWEDLPSPTKLDDSELSKQCQIAYGNDFEYEAAEFSDLWYCACGALNRKTEGACHKCSRTFKRLSDSDIQELTAAMEQRLAEEKHQRELAEQKRKEEEAEAERIRIISEAAKEQRKKRKNKIFSCAGIAMAVMLAVFLLATKIIIPSQKYNSAVALMDAGQYEQALYLLDSLPNFKKGNDLLYQCYLMNFHDSQTMDIDTAIHLLQTHRGFERILPFSSSDLIRLKNCSGLYEGNSKYQLLKIRYYIEIDNILCSISYDNFLGTFPNPGKVTIPKNNKEKVIININGEAASWLDSDDRSRGFRFEVDEAEAVATWLSHGEFDDRSDFLRKTSLQ